MKINESAPARIIINCSGIVIVVGEFHLIDCLANNSKKKNQIKVFK